MREITSVEISRALGEMSNGLRESRLRKFYDLGDGAFRFLFYKKEGSIHVYCRLLATFNQTQFTESSVDQATPFAMGIRKRLENATLTDARQHNSDRIIVLEFGKEGYRLVIEMFGKGNMILINALNRIELCYKTVRYKERSVAAGNPYEFPRSSTIPFDSLTEEGVASLLSLAPADKKIIRYLSDYLNVGPLYLEDIIKRSGLDPRGALLDKGAIPRLTGECLLFFQRMKEERPRIYLENGVPKDYAIVGVERYAGFEFREYESFNELLDDISMGRRTERVDEGKIAARSKLKSNIEAQKELVVSMNAESAYYADAGRKIFENMHGINSLVAYLQKNRNASLEETRKAFGEMVIKEVDLKNKRVKIEL